MNDDDLRLAPAGASDAAQAPGLVAEDAVRTDDMVVRRVRDGSNGVVCYAVSSYAYVVAPHGRSVAIACVHP